MLHNLKIEPRWFKQIKDNTKRYEIRLNDRNYKVGDTLKLNEIGTDCYELRVVSSILYSTDFPKGLQENYCIMSLCTIDEVLSSYESEGFNWYQLKQIKLGLECGLDVSKYVNKGYSDSLMYSIRISLSKGEL